MIYDKTSFLERKSDCAFIWQGYNNIRVSICYVLDPHFAGIMVFHFENTFSNYLLITYSFLKSALYKTYTYIYKKILSIMLLKNGGE